MRGGIRHGKGTDDRETRPWGTAERFIGRKEGVQEIEARRNAGKASRKFNQGFN